MSAVRDKALMRLEAYLLIAYGTGLQEQAMDTKAVARDMLRCIPEIAVVDKKAKVPQREKLSDGHLLLKAENKNDIYLNGQLFAQEKMLKEGWKKEILDD